MIRILAIFILIGNSVLGQSPVKISYELQSDTFYNSPNTAFNNKIKISRIDKSIATLEIRLYKHYSLSNTISLRRIYLKNEVWGADEFDELNNPITIKKYKLIPTLSFDSLLMQLHSYNLFTLPSQSNLRSRMKKFTGEIYEGDSTFRSISVHDGESYFIEVKVENKFRVYEFSNPDAYSHFYENITEFKNFLNIVNTFNSSLKRNNR